MLLAIVCIAGLTPGIATAWWIYRTGRGWPLALALGFTVTAALPLALLATMALFPAIGAAVGVASALAALHAYDKGQVFVCGAWAVAAFISLSCAGWAIG
ncbi:hypothetical protein [Streptomyces sp. DSM 40484]|uniref:hypothetical protein n=1 Tax=Streptomyces kroppenstedtii TaxID=3051181 RepID=UPI0028D77BFB|nr:hypothetical protein [Streptomyces sp. DSM 40484]